MAYISIQNFLLCFVSLYILTSIVFCAHFTSCDGLFFARPVLNKTYNSLTVFFFFVLLGFFCFDFDSSNSFNLFNQNIQLAFVFFSLCVLLCSRDYIIAKNIQKYEYDLLIVFVIFSAICLCFSNDLLLLYLAIELQSLTFYVLASFHKHSEFAIEAGLKYFIFGGLMSCILLLGLSLIYLFFGTITFEFLTVFLCFINKPYLFIGFFFVIIVFLFKLGCVPFHFWLADIYEGSMLSVTMLFACLPKLVLFCLLYKLCFLLLFNFSEFWVVLIGWAAVFSITLASVSAIYQKRLKRLFAYSTIAHTGFILLPFCCYTVDASASFIFYVVVYSIMTTSLFANLINGSLSTKYQPKYVINVSAFGNTNGLFAFCFTLIILAVAGIPPLLGFFSKFLVLFTMIESAFFYTSFVVIVFSTIACFYYIRLIKILFFTNQSKNVVWISNTTNNYTEVVLICFLFVILLFFLYPNPILNFAIVISFLTF